MSVRLSTTSFAVLGMLAIRTWTPYELTQQTRRSLRYCWPVSERALYNEPERLVAAGLAEVQTEESGLRTRRTYSITPSGRRTLGEWLSTRPTAPVFQFETLLRLVLADQGSVESLLTAVGAFRQDLDGMLDEGVGQMAPYLEGSGPFPERAHLIALFADLYSRIFRTMIDWADDATAEISTWQNTGGLGMTEDAKRRLENMVLQSSSGDGSPSDKAD